MYAYLLFFARKAFLRLTLFRQVSEFHIFVARIHFPEILKVLEFPFPTLTKRFIVYNYTIDNRSATAERSVGYSLIITH
jgi:hypothetical protein